MEGHDHSSYKDNHMNNFCQSMSSGGGMSMYMSGFRSSLLDSDAPCLNLLSPNWTLDSELKFIAGMIAVACLGILLEAIPVWRLRYLARIDRDGVDRENKNARLILTAFHGAQALLGYTLMLAAMTYSVELILSTVIGLSLGFYIFYKPRSILTANQSSSPSPCCEFLDDNADESTSALYSQLGPDSNEEEDHRSNLHQRTNVANDPGLRRGLPLDM
mmetsp:Transcript_4753/g.7213  ORF Transcript_4753/g.7213 Transcript_4753/m.7213 type:complete len:217 (+) Transcript_4753:107-757(+)